jgi:O-methyltransferase/methyltransferase family protein
MKGGPSMADETRSMHDAPPPEEAVMQQLMNGYRVTQLLYVAVKLGVPDLLAGGPKTAEELAEVAGAHAEALYRALRALASLGVFTAVAPRRFALTPLADLLRTDHPRSLRALVIFQGEEVYRAWGELLYAVQTGAPAFDHVYHMSHFDYLAQHADASVVFNRSMSDNTARSVAAIVAASAFPATGVIVDVGGGHGAFIAAVLRAHLRLHGVLFDQPHVVEGAAPTLEAAGVAQRCERVGGDFFAPPLPMGDLYTLRQIIHDWDDERSIAILRHCTQAMAPDGKVLVIEALIPPGNEPSPVKFVDLQMLVMNGGRQRTEEEYRQLYAASGLRLTRVIPTRSQFSIVEGVRMD